MKKPPVSRLFGVVLLWATLVRADTPSIPVTTKAEKSGPVFVNEIVIGSDTELKATDTDYRHVSFYHASWGLSQAVPVGESGNLTFGLAYTLSHRRVTDPPSWEDNSWKEFKSTHPDWNRIPIPRVLQSLSASIEYGQTIDDYWSISSCISTGSYTAKKGLLSDGWGAATSVMAQYKWSPTLTLAFGAAYDSLSHDYRYVPLVGFDWQFSDKWSAAIGFPSTAVTYTMNRHLSMAIELSGAGGTYHVKDDPAPGAAVRSLASSKLETTEVRLGFKIGWKINDTYSISATTGHVVYREYKYIDRDYKLRSHDISEFGAISGTISF